MQFIVLADLAGIFDQILIILLIVVMAVLVVAVKIIEIDVDEGLGIEFDGLNDFLVNLGFLCLLCLVLGLELVIDLQQQVQGVFVNFLDISPENLLLLFADSVLV